MKVLTILDGQSLLALANIAKQLERLADAWEGKKPSPAPAPVEVEPEPNSSQDLTTAARLLSPKRVAFEDYVSDYFIFSRTFGQNTPARFRGEKTGLLLDAINATSARNGVHKNHRFVHRDDVQKVVDWMNAHRK